MAALADPNTRFSEAETALWADGVVLAFQTPPSADDAQERLAGEANAVQAGLKAVSEAKWAEVPKVLSSIPHRSAFRHWATFIKGMAAFYTRDDAKAARCFQGLPAESIPARAARAFRLLMDPAVPAAG